MGLLGVGFCATALVAVWPDDGVGVQPAAALTVPKADSVATESGVSGNPVIEIPAGGGIYCHPELETCVHLSTAVQEADGNE